MAILPTTESETIMSKSTLTFTRGEAVKWLDAAVNAGQPFDKACAKYALKAKIGYDELRDAYIKSHE